MRRAFTLIEALVVISVIGILIALSLKAVQYSRDVARRHQCQNNLKNIATATYSHNASHQIIPSNGWGPEWVGESQRGFGVTQPGGWLYSLLPYIEQSNVHGMSTGATAIQRKANAAKMLGVSIPTYVCVSRRSELLYPFVSSIPFRNCDRVDLAAKTDYAINAMVAGIKRDWSLLEIRDGLSQTILAGEKRLIGSKPASGGDEQTLYMGHDDDIARSATSELLHDTASNPSGDVGFGSTHSGVSNFAFFDSSIHAISYKIDKAVFQSLGTPTGGEVVDSP
jgi:prepilin-type N-terminal cleavage/methylation domain-containing protein